MTAASSHGPFWLQHPTAEELRSVLRASRNDAPSYPEVGATRRGETPEGYAGIRKSAVLSREPGAFPQACAGLRAWAPHRRAGISLLPATPALVEGETLLGCFRSFPFWVTTACRVVWVVDEEARFGFGYATLPHHPEQGEEAFVVERDEEGEVRFVITAFSRPAHRLTRLASPVSKLIQARVTRHYLAGLREFRAAEPA